MTRENRSPRRTTPTLYFLALWIAVPTLFRAATLLTLLPLRSAWLNGELWPLVAPALRVLALALPQDALIALQALLVIVALKSLMPRWLAERLSAVWACFATLLFLAVQSYLLFDFLLHLKTGLRMEYDFLAFFVEAKSFVSSAWEVGLAGLAIGAAALVIGARIAYRVFVDQMPSLRLSWPLVASFPLVALLVANTRDSLPSDLAYQLENAILADEARFIARLANEPSRAADVSTEEILRWLEPQAETFRRAAENDQYPLLKYTEGFRGEKQFELELKPGERPHVVFLFLESFRAADVGVLGGKHNASPNFDRLSKQGVLFTNFYGNGVQTTRGVMAGLFGIVPEFTPKAAQAVHPELPLIGVADLLNQRGYTSAFITANSLEFENKIGFFPRHGYAEVLGDRDVAKRFPQADHTSWGLHDEYLMPYLVDWLAEKDRQQQPAFVTSFTISHHHPWHVPAHYKAPTFQTGANAEYARFLQTFHYTDACLGQFFERLKAKGLDKKTIVFVLADTATPQGEHHDNFMLVNYLYEENLRIPLLIVAPGHLKRPAVIDDVGSQVDLLPTMMDLLGLEGWNHAVGTTLVRHVPGRTAYFNNPFAMQYQGLRHGDHKYIFNLRANRSSLYLLDNDPGEERDVAAQFASDVSAYQRKVSAINRFLLQLSLTERFVGRDLPAAKKVGHAATVPGSAMTDAR
jgi:arylsulfatase A-like enzyme